MSDYTTLLYIEIVELRKQYGIVLQRMVTRFLIVMSKCFVCSVLKVRCDAEQEFNECLINQ